MEKELEKKIKVESLMGSFTALDSLKLGIKSQLVACAGEKSDYSNGLKSAYVAVIDCIDGELLKIREKLRKRYNITLCTEVTEVIHNG